MCSFFMLSCFLGHTILGDYMFYSVSDEVTSIDFDEIDSSDLTLGYIDKSELEKIVEKLHFNKKAVVECEKSRKHFRQQIESYDDYIFATLKIANNNTFDSFAFFASENLFLIVDVNSNDESIRNVFMTFLGKISCYDDDIEKLVFLFFDSVFEMDSRAIESMQDKIGKMEEIVEKNRTKSNFNLQLFDIKNKLINMRNYYEHIIDIAEIMADNYNDVFNRKNVKYFKYIEKKAQRLKECVDFMRDNVMHLREAYQSYLELKLNQTMKLLTVFTVVFSPLTLITGWYGMNFHNMPMISWKYGYLLTVIISIIVVITIIVIFKKKKLI